MLLTGLHYFSARPLWGDEEMVLKNINMPGYKAIFGRYVEPQLFPRIQLVIVKFISSFFNQNVWALRFISFVMMLSAFWVWVAVFKRLKHPGMILLSVLSFVASFRFVYYASELKPYAVDVLACGTICYFLLYLGEVLINKAVVFSKQKALLFTCLIPLWLFVSYGAFFVFWLVPVQYFLMGMQDRKWFKWFSLSLLASGACFLFFYFIDLRFSLNIQATYDYWDSYFICSTSLQCFGATLFDGIRKLVTFWFGDTKLFIRLGTPLIPVFILGLFYSGIKDWKDKKGNLGSIFLIALVIFVELFFFGIFKKYPFTGERITLFFAPLVFAVLVKTLFDMRKVKYLGSILISYYVLFCLASLINSALVFSKKFIF
ncbi:MAG: hypothetical protein HQL25_01310 [Candidatus Omnitrophica bacterium]|nr:hypothetical protein [Candidatus Omnitrophota bacterium]